MSVLRTMPQPNFLKTMQDTDGIIATTFSDIASKHAKTTVREYAGGEGGQGGS